MKYSEAIRLGSMLYPQCYGDLREITADGFAVCANGAAAVALGFDPSELKWRYAPPSIRRLFSGKVARCPVCRIKNTLLSRIVHLNDEHSWTRERIADWLAASGHDFEIDLSKPECAPAAEPVAAGVAGGMKRFHISDVLSVTTGRLVSDRHMDGVYDILNFLTGDQLFTHQLPRAVRECEPWLRSQFPALFIENPQIAAALTELDGLMDPDDSREARSVKLSAWVERLRLTLGLPKRVAVYEMPPDMHTLINPIAEAQAMVGDDKVIVVEGDA